METAGLKRFNAQAGFLRYLFMIVSMDLHGSIISKLEAIPYPSYQPGYSEEELNSNNPVVQLCIQGTQAEFEGKPDNARALYWQAWNSAQDDFDACIAAHYVARFQDNPEAALRWNQEALNRANAAPPELIQDFFPSLYLNLGRSFERLGNIDEAHWYYDLATQLGYRHGED